METRKCKKCKTTFDLTTANWYVRKESGTITTHTCVYCVRKAAKASRDKALSKDRTGYNLSSWARRVKNNYGISLDEYTVIMSSTTTCTICGKEPTGKFSDKLVYDHCHATGKFRGVLCNKCNVGIGALGDTAADLLKAYQYLQEIEDSTCNNYNE